MSGFGPFGGNGRPRSSGRRRCTFRLVALALAVVAATITTPTTRAEPAPASPTLAHLRMTVSVTSDWAKVRITPGRLLAHRVLDNPAAAGVRQEDDGVFVTNPTPGQAATLTIDGWFAEATGAGTFTFSLFKGASHAVSIAVDNVSGDPFHVVGVANAETRPDLFGNYVVRADTSRARLFGAVQPPLPRPETPRRVLAFYYPWFSGGQYRDLFLSDRPSHPRSTATWEGVLSMTRQARDAGVTGFVVSWMGDSQDGHELDLVVRAAEATGGTATIVLETDAANAALDSRLPTDPALVRDWLSQAVERADSPAFLREGDVPVVFVWQTDRLAASTWKAILDELAAAGKPVRLVGDGDDAAHGGVTWGSYRYDANRPLDQLGTDNQYAALGVRARAASGATGTRLYAATVSPGYEDRRLTGLLLNRVDRGRNGERYVGTWDAAELADPDWILVTSWNEWYEGTSIEPSRRYGDRALRQTRDRAGAWRSSS
jgi:glycoprotein endo-alpha-1,2-mannosidase